MNWEPTEAASNEVPSADAGLQPSFPRSSVGPKAILSALSVTVMITVTVVSALQNAHGLTWAGGAAALLLIILQRRRIPRKMVLTTSLILALALASLPFTSDPLPRVEQGVAIGILFVSLMASVSLIAARAEQSQLIRRIGTGLLRQPSERRYLSFNLTGHIFAAALSLAGTSILCVMARNGLGRTTKPAATVQLERVAMFSGIHRGFSTAICWSPMFGNMALLLALYPQLDWPHVLPLGISVAGCLAVVGFLFSLRGTLRLRKMNAGEPAQSRSGLASLLPVLCGIVVFFTAVMTFREAIGTSATIAIILLSPVAAMAWRLLEDMPEAAGGIGSTIVFDAVERFPTMASEATLFISAGCASAIIADAVSPSMALTIAQPIIGSSGLAAMGLMSAIILSSLVGVHPVLTSLMLANTLTYQLLAIPAQVHFVAILTGWAIATTASPFTILSFMIARSAEKTPFDVSVRWNGFYSLISILAVSALLDLAAEAGIL